MPKTIDSTSEPEVLSFAGKLAKLAREVPDGYCRKELDRMINDIRTYQIKKSEVEEKREIFINMF